VLGAKLILTVAIGLKVIRAVFFEHLCKVLLFLLGNLSLFTRETSSERAVPVQM